jgi:DNA-binding response OmpR family regulator
MKRVPCVLIVDADILVRHPLAEYLRECGYRVVQAAYTDEVRALFTRSRRRVIDVVLADVNAPGAENAFALATWIRAHHARVQVILAGTVDAAAERAGDLCEDGPTLSKPYDPQLLLDRIRRALATRDQAG